VESRVSALIASAEAGDHSAADTLFDTLYDELHRLAESQLAHNGGGVTLGVTTLLHEAYLDMSQRESLAFPDRSRFMAYAAKVMRGLIVDYARHRRAQKRGGGFEFMPLGAEAGEDQIEHAELSEIAAALERLAAVDATLAELVDLRFFCGFSFAEIAAMRGTSERTLQRRWEKARIYLHGAIRPLEGA